MASRSQPTALEIHWADLRREYRLRAALVRPVDPSLADALMRAERDVGTDAWRVSDLDLLEYEPEVPPMPVGPAVSWDLQTWSAPGQQ